MSSTGALQLAIHFQPSTVGTSQAMAYNLQSDHTCSNCGHVDSNFIIGTEIKPEQEPEPEPEPERELEPESGFETGSEPDTNQFSKRIIRDRREFDNTYHPGVEATELVHKVHGIRVSRRKIDYKRMKAGTDCYELLCHNCGWNSDQQTDSRGYTSRLKVAFLRYNAAAWDLGPNGPWMLRDETNNPTNMWSADYMTQNFIRENLPTIPLVEMHRYGSADDKFHFTVMSRAKGRPMDDIWESLTHEQKCDVLLDLQGHIKQWRQITSPEMRRVDGSELPDPVIGNCHPERECIKTGRNEDEWLENLKPAIRKGLLMQLWNDNRRYRADKGVLRSWVVQVDEQVAQLLAKFPRGGPYILTHANLRAEKIFVSDDNAEKKFKVSAILGWRRAGFFPWWVEPLCHLLPRGTIDLLGDDMEFFSLEHGMKDLENILTVVSDFCNKWTEGGGHVRNKHGLNGANIWFRKPFCACRPYLQKYRDNCLGWKQDHVDVFEVESSDSEDERRERVIDVKGQERDLSKDERKFMHWINEISREK